VTVDAVRQGDGGDGGRALPPRRPLLAGRDTRAPIDPTATCSTVDPGHAALVTLRGTAAQELRATIGETGREIMPNVQGDHPAES
jgi:hypothetical protein